MSGLSRARSAIAAAVMVAALASCQTYAVVVDAPAEFWLTAEAIVEALVLDVWSVVELFF